MIQTLLEQFPGTADEDHYQHVVDELSDGGMFKGFTAANRDDVISLAHSAGMNTSTIDFILNEVPAQHLIETLGSPLDDPAFNSYAVGFIDEISPTDSDRVIALVLAIRQQPPDNFATIGFNTRTSNAILLGDRLRPHTGVMLYRKAVPEPTTLCLSVSIATIGFLLECKTGQNDLLKSF